MMLKGNDLLAALVVLCTVTVIPSQALGDTEDTRKFEVLLTNETDGDVVVKLEPVGFIFNDLLEYNLVSSPEAGGPGAANEPITGVEVTISAQKFKGGVANHIATSTDVNIDRHIGYGKYRMTVTGWGSIYLDFSDSDYPEWYANNGWPRDLFFELKANGTLYWTNEQGHTEYLLDAEQVVEIWDQRFILGPSFVKAQNVSGFSIPPAVSTIPLDGTDAVVQHHNPGELRVEVKVQGDITVAQGKTFAPEPPAKLFFATGKQLSVDGSLVAAGSASNPIVFDRQGSSGTWGGIVFNSGSTGTIDYATLRHAAKGIFVDSASPTIRNSTIEDFTEQGVYGVDSDLVVQDSFIGNAPSASHGIYLLGSGQPTVSGNTIDDVAIGIERKGSPGQATLSGNTIKRCTDGIKTWQSSPEIFNNDVENNLWGVRLWTDSAPDLHDNDIYSNSVGVYLEQSQPSNVKWNNFGASGGTLLENADEGILVNDLESGNTFLDGKWNNFYDGYVTKDIANPTSVTLKATGNYWYDQTITGPVDASSPQTRANPDAGPGGAQGKLADSGWQASPQKVDVVPATFRLEPNFPNPFNPRTVIRFALPEEAVVTVTILDVGGRLVRRLVLNTSYAAGTHEVTWDGRNPSGEVVASGVYFYRMEALTNAGDKPFTDSRKLVLIR